MHRGFLPVWSKRHLSTPRPRSWPRQRYGKRAFPSRRRLIAADGVYEWRTEPEASETVMWIGLPLVDPCAMAGLWGKIKNEKNDWVQSATIITCPLSDLMQPIHNRMLVVPSREAETLWLGPMSQVRDELRKARPKRRTRSWRGRLARRR